MAAMVNEGTEYVLNRSDFSVKEDRLTSITIDSLPARGMLCYDGSLIDQPGGTVCGVDILIGNLTFVPVKGEAGASYATFDYTAHNGAVQTHSGYIIFDVVTQTSGKNAENQPENHAENQTVIQAAKTIAPSATLRTSADKPAPETIRHKMQTTAGLR